MPPVKFSHNPQFGSLEPVKLEFVFIILLNLHLKIFAKLHDSVSRIQNFLASEGAQPPHTPLAHKDILFKVEGRLCRISSLSVVQITTIVHHIQYIIVVQERN